MKVKVSEVKDIALDWLVAKCEGKNGVLHDDEITRCIVVAAPSGVYKGIWKPHFIWMQAGPIIEREKIKISPNLVDSWSAQIHRKKGELAGWTSSTGSTPLIAAMRCYVASKMGEEVEIPEGLL